MLITIILLSLLSLFLVGCLVVSINKNLEQMAMIETTSELIHESIQYLDRIHERVEAKTKLEVLSDDPIVRDLVNDIRDARDTVKFVLEKMGPLTQLEEDLDENDLEEEP